MTSCGSNAVPPEGRNVTVHTTQTNSNFAVTRVCSYTTCPLPPSPPLHFPPLDTSQRRFKLLPLVPPKSMLLTINIKAKLFNSTGWFILRPPKVIIIIHAAIIWPIEAYMAIKYLGTGENKCFTEYVGMCSIPIGDKGRQGDHVHKCSCQD
jgi:hypothetical protein